MCPHTAALACVDQINKNVSSIFFIFLGTWCLKNGISSRQDALHIAWLCGISADVEKDCSYQFLQTISGSEPDLSGTEEVDTLRAAHRYVLLAGVQLCPPH